MPDWQPISTAPLDRDLRLGVEQDFAGMLEKAIARDAWKLIETRSLPQPE
jgi:hypothetical protein